MKKTILTTLIGGLVLCSSFIPSDAEALKVKFRPSITFKPTSERVYYRPAREIAHPGYSEVTYDPYTGVSYIEEYPGYVEYRAPRIKRSRSYSPNLKFKLKFK